MEFELEFDWIKLSSKFFTLILAATMRGTASASGEKWKGSPLGIQIDLNYHPHRGIITADHNDHFAASYHACMNTSQYWRNTIHSQETCQRKHTSKFKCWNNKIRIEKIKFWWTWDASIYIIILHKLRPSSANQLY